MTKASSGWLPVVLATLLTACSTTAPTTGIRLPPTAGSFDYQLGGVDDTRPLAVVVRDATAQPMPGAYDVCYVNGFQSQPDDGDRWLKRYGEAVLRDAGGTPVTDPDWPDEYVLDPSTERQRTVILDVLEPLIADCAAKGFDAVEIDNFDTFTRFSDSATGRIDRSGAIALARSFADFAHDHGLAIGQKNAAEAVDAGRREVGFDFAVAEECAAYRECGRYTEVYGPHVLQIEYTDNLPAPFSEVCDSPDRAPVTILRDRNLVARGTEGHVYEQCP
ncbi:endo alpha-1,4 polygalactosaminidase [Mycolicibacterium sp.]|uniref:endo alpha-1,4 polygalactosaminidase n=1 Tax=Mycolicibacterium sp. TaxID=2320850 RepID=UPI001A23FC4C|nr:endo alpha-1,4 polygalactosaminidase [Mycolicibacterium sp.]MBJ7340765.1 endo alpha-1,4 polygalactosaminidase [Mycolicibacterium sp.]